MKLLKHIRLFFYGLLLVSGQVCSDFTARSLDALDEPTEFSELALTSYLVTAVRAGDSLIVVGERGHIMTSTDGVTWAQAYVPVRTTMTSVFFIDSKVGWAVGHDTVILKTEDGGMTWRKLIDGRQANQMVLLTAEERLRNLQLPDSNGNGDWPVPDANLEFAELALAEAERDSEIGPNKALMDIWFADKNIGIAVGASGYVLLTDDGGDTWTDGSQGLESVDFLHLYKLFGGPDRSLFLVGESAQAYRSENFGRNWTRLEVPYEGSFFGGISRNSDGSIYVYGMSGVVLRSDDKGESWGQLPSPSTAILQAASIISDDRLAFVGLGGTLIVENISNSTFEKIDLGTRSSFSSLETVNDLTLLLVGESGLTLVDTTSKYLDWNINSSKSFRLLHHQSEAGTELLSNSFKYQSD